MVFLISLLLETLEANLMTRYGGYFAAPISAAAGCRHSAGSGIINQLKIILRLKHSIV